MRQLECFQAYSVSIRQRHRAQPTRNHPESIPRKEYICPLCKSLGNAILPVVNPSTTKLNATPFPDCIRAAGILKSKPDPHLLGLGSSNGTCIDVAVVVSIFVIIGGFQKCAVIVRALGLMSSMDSTIESTEEVAVVANKASEIRPSWTVCRTKEKEKVRYFEGTSSAANPERNRGVCFLGLSRSRLFERCEKQQHGEETRVVGGCEDV